MLDVVFEKASVAPQPYLFGLMDILQLQLQLARTKMERAVKAAVMHTAWALSYEQIGTSEHVARLL